MNAWLRPPSLISISQVVGAYTSIGCSFADVNTCANVVTYPEAALPHPQSSGLKEHSTLEPTNPYSAAKAGAEMMCKAYITSYKMPIIITRGNNVYGPHQFPEKMIPKFTLLASKGLDLPVHGDGSAIRWVPFYAQLLYTA